jgi:hypothetical protein
MTIKIYEIVVSREHYDIEAYVSCDMPVQQTRLGQQNSKTKTVKITVKLKGKVKK